MDIGHRPNYVYLYVTILLFPAHPAPPRTAMAGPHGAISAPAVLSLQHPLHVLRHRVRNDFHLIRSDLQRKGVGL